MKDSYMAKTIQEAFKQAQFFSDEQDYVIIKLPARAITTAAGIVAESSMPFCALIIDKDEVSLMIIKDAVEEFANRLINSQVSDTSYRLITIEAELDLEMVGFMATVSKALADANVNIMTYAAYTTDHFLVPSEKFDTAMTVLKQLQSELS